MKRTIILVVFMLVPVFAAAPETPPVSERVGRILERNALKGAEVSMYAFNLNEGREVFSVNPDKQLNPASLTKVVTSGAALYYLGPHYRFSTDVFLEGLPEDDGVVRGNLYLKSNGDPRFVNEMIFHFGLELQKEGIRRVDGDVIIDMDFFDDKYYKPGWQKEVGIRAYYAPVSAFAVDFNSFSIFVKPSSEVGGKAAVMIQPPIGYLKLKNTAKTSKKKNSLDVKIKDRDKFLEVTVTGEISKGSNGRSFNRRVENPEKYGASVLGWIWGLAGLKIKGNIKRGKITNNAEMFYTYYSPALSLILRDMNKQSNNFTADVLLKHLGGEVYGPPATYEKGLKMLDEFLKDAGVEPGEYLFTNGSGLSHENRMSARNFVKVFNFIYSDFRLMPDFVSSLSIAGYDGTVRKRFFNTSCESVLRAKTGTIDGVASLGGYVINGKGELITFAIMVNGFEQKLYRNVTDSIDAMAVELAR